MTFFLWKFMGFHNYIFQFDILLGLLKNRYVSLRSKDTSAREFQFLNEAIKLFYK